MYHILISVILVIAVVIGGSLIPFVLLVAYRRRLFDSVDCRKIHIGIVPRLGGVVFVPVQAILLIISMFFLYLYDPTRFIDNYLTFYIQCSLLLSGLILLFIVGLVDDLIGVGYKFKFAAQIVAALFLPLSGIWINNLYGVCGLTFLSPWVGIPLTIFIVVLIVNAINLIDGLDGLSSGLCIIAGVVLGIFFVNNAFWVLAIFSFITVGVLLSFFYYNVFGVSKRRRIFMGDVGSLTLGLSMSFLAISCAMYTPETKDFSAYNLLLPFSVLFVPVFDLFRVMCLRLRKHTPLFKPDNNHIHHKLLKLRIPSHMVLILILSLSLLIVMLNLLLTEYVDTVLILLLDVIVWMGFHAYADKLCKVRSEQLNGKQQKHKEQTI